MHSRTLSIALILLAACFVPTTDPTGIVGPDGGVGGAGGGGGASGSVRCLPVNGVTELVCATLTPVVCAGRTCAAGEVCCIVSGACVLPGSAACPAPITTGPVSGRPCASNADCTSEEYCIPDELRLSGAVQQRCTGIGGHCQPLLGCGYCGGTLEQCQVCGCNGVTYPSPQVACVAGVVTINRGACGVPRGQDGGAFTISCGTSEQCPAGAQCCFRTGKCFASTEPWRCEPLPSGAVLDCASHGECHGGSGGGSGNEPPTRLCAADGCGGPGLCLNRSSYDCGGEVQSVCGCDGLTYVNACWARAAGVRVASNGACP